ncbi:hypothetical protein CDCA_CDCA11G3130 [Cyanidium caldarium]|uniref:Man1/Src1-like C-terminal domain-containing protein n=1 Tax=Cyanidium caldarium TaxID=2771 RepID=A0AAV9IYD6_CYACA|nr:hypothetical protein CDCA_CDCA11G3130 [Cyanidium caldarium]
MDQKTVKELREFVLATDPSEVPAGKRPRKRDWVEAAERIGRRQQANGPSSNRKSGTPHASVTRGASRRNGNKVAGGRVSAEEARRSPSRAAPATAPATPASTTKAAHRRSPSGTARTATSSRSGRKRQRSTPLRGEEARRRLIGEEIPMDRSPDGGAWAEREYSLSMGEHVRMLQREREWAAAAAAAQTVGPSRLFPYPLGQAHERGGVFHWPGPFGYNRLEASTSASQAGALEAATTMSSSSSARVGSGRSGARLGIRHAIRGVLGGELRPQSEELEYIEYPEDVLPPEELMPEPPPRRTSVSDVSHQSGREASAPAAVTTAESGGGSGSAALLRSMRRSGVTKSTTERAMTSPPLGSRDSGCPEAADVGGAAGSSVTPDTKQSDSSGGDRERVGALLDSGARISACCARGDLPAHQPLTPMQTFRTLRGAGVGRRAGAAAPSMPTAERQTRWASSADGTRSSPPTITPALPTTVNANITARGGTLAAPRLAPAPPPLASMGMEPMDYPRAAPAVTTAAAPGTRWQALRFGRCKWLLTALLWFSLLLRLYWTLPSTPFCDTGEDPATSHGPCRVCPPHGHCAGGVLSCAGGYVVLGGRCVPDREVNRYAHTIQAQVQRVLGRAAGARACDDTSVRHQWTAAELREEIARLPYMERVVNSGKWEVSFRRALETIDLPVVNDRADRRQQRYAAAADDESTDSGARWPAESARPAIDGDIDGDTDDDQNILYWSTEPILPLHCLLSWWVQRHAPWWPQALACLPVALLLGWHGQRLRARARQLATLRDQVYRRLWVQKLAHQHAAASSAITPPYLVDVHLRDELLGHCRLPQRTRRWKQVESLVRADSRVQMRCETFADGRRAIVWEWTAPLPSE